MSTYYVRDAEIFDDEGNAIEGLKITKITASNQSRMIASPVETGSMTFDNKVSDPGTIIVVGYVRADDIPNVQRKLFDAVNNRDWKFWSVACKEDYWKRLMMVKVSHEETNDKHDVIEYTIEFTEVLWDSDIGQGNGQTNPSGGSTFSSTVSTGMGN